MVSPPSAPSSARPLSLASLEMVPLILINRELVESDQLSVSSVLYRRPSPMLQPVSPVSPSAGLCQHRHPVG